MSIGNIIDIKGNLSPHHLIESEAARFVVDTNGLIIYANEAFFEISGITPDGQNYIQDSIQFSEEDLENIEDLSAIPAGIHDVHIKDSGIMSEFQFDWINTPDNRRYLIASAVEEGISSENNINDKLDGLMEKIHDSASRIEQSFEPANIKNVKDEHTYFNNHSIFTEMAKDLMVVTDISGEIIYNNSAFLQLIDNDNNSFFELFKKEDRAQIISTINAFKDNNINEGDIINIQAHLNIANSSTRFIEWQIKYSDCKIYAIGKDITEIIEKQKNLQRREKQLSEAEAIGRMGHWHWLVGDEHISWSEEIFRIFGVDQNHFKPGINSLASLIHKRDLGRVIQVFQRAIIEEKNYDMEFRIIRPDGDVRFIMCEGRCEKNNEGEVIALYGIMQDMTERMLYEEELRQAKDASEQAYAARTRFLANMSHELRTPLNAIIGFSEMIESQMLGPIFNEKYVEYATSIKESGHHLLDLISDILDMSKIEAGKHVLDLETININDIIQRCIEMIRGRATEQHVNIKPFKPENQNLSIIADRRALTQIFLNLLSNAVKFTRENGSVWVECHENNDYISFKICDTGIGIPPNKLASVLRPFEQASSEYTRDYEGTGLGLSITKELIELHGGSIHIDSTVNIGTIVSVRLPLNSKNNQE